MKAHEMLLILVVVGTQLFIMARCVIKYNCMGWSTNHFIRIGYVLIGSGSFAIIYAVFDYSHGDPQFWPWLMLAGLAGQGLGTLVVSLVTHRKCHGTECPAREVWATHKAPEGHKCGT